MAPGNKNAFFHWDAPANDGGDSPITDYKVTVKAVITNNVVQTIRVSATDACGTFTNPFPCVIVNNLNNQTEYSFSVQAQNGVGLSNASATVKTTPTRDASVKQIGNTGGARTQNTGDSATPSTGDPFVGIQTFGTTTTGVGLLWRSLTLASAVAPASPGPCSLTS